MGEKTGSRRGARRRAVWRVRWSRTLNIGANLPAREDRNWGRKALGKSRDLLRCLWNLVCMACMTLGEAMQKAFGRPAARAAHWCAWLYQAAEQRRADYLLEDRRRRKSRAPACALLAAVTISLISASYFSIGVEVLLDGKSLGYVESVQQMEDIVAQVEERTSGYLGRPYSLSADLSYSLGYVQRDNLLDSAVAEEALFAQVGEVSSQYIISVDGQPIGANPSKTALELLKQRLLSAQVGADENARAEFVQDVTIEQANVPDTYVSSIAEIEQALSGERSAMQVYAVQQGDTLSQIAERNGMTLQQVQGLNPQIDPDRIHIGEQITLAGSKPMLSVKKTTVLEYTQPIAYETEVQYSDEMYKNQSKIITEGQNGQASVVANVVSVDGVEQERVIQSWDVIQQPQSEVKLVGTKALPTKAAKGYFIQPFRGILTSRFGARSRGYHTGVDWAGAKGSPVVAADGGTVIQAGWNGGYGYCVTISHGNGLTTLYAHNSSLLVKVGQKVAQGEQIAKLGSTGNSTGPHCHWEVRVNGKAVNPLNYLK